MQSPARTFCTNPSLRNLQFEICNLQCISVPTKFQSSPTTPPASSACTGPANSAKAPSSLLGPAERRRVRREMPGHLRRARSRVRIRIPFDRVWNFDSHLRHSTRETPIFGKHTEEQLEAASLATG